MKTVRVATWSVVLGSVGLLCGYFGPLQLLAEPGSAAPLLGIFVTGPLGFVLGGLLGWLSVALHWNTKQNVLLFAFAVIAGASSSLFLAVSDYKASGRLADGEIVGCEKVDQLLAAKTKEWSEIVAKAKYANVRRNWKEEIPSMVSAQPGAVLSLRIYRETSAREQRWRWGETSRKVDDWKSTDKVVQVFGPVSGTTSLSPCEQFVVGERRFFRLVWEKSNDTPPSRVTAFLGLYVLQDVPPEYRDYLPAK